jgi:hypothetical protein
VSNRPSALVANLCVRGASSAAAVVDDEGTVDDTAGTDPDVTPGSDVAGELFTTVDDTAGAVPDVTSGSDVIYSPVCCLTTTAGH